MTAISTSRLKLRALRMDDADAIVRLIGDFDVAGNLARVPYPYGRKDAEAWLSRQAETTGEEVVFAIDLPGDGYAGSVGFHTDDKEGLILGYWLGRPFWGRGLMTEAAGAACTWFFETRKDAFIRSGAFTFNAASLAVQRKLGFRATGQSEIMCIARGEKLAHVDTRLDHTDHLALMKTQGRA